MCKELSRLLVAVAKFIDKKYELKQLDEGFQYARACLLAYAGWMLSHEYPYLDKPEILEYPNETWPAQDLRKSVIFFQASRYAHPELHAPFRQKGRDFFEISRTELLRRETSRYSRPLALMLQNGWVEHKLINDTEDGVLSGEPARIPSGRPTPCLSFGAVMGRSMSEMFQAVRKMSLKREIAWFRSRYRV